MKLKKIEYEDEKVLLEAFISYKEEKRPTILIFHAWRGRDEFVIEKAKQLADEGYIGCAVDIYGKNKLGKSAEENNKFMQPFMEDRNFLRKRILSGWNMVKNLKIVDPEKIGAMGFCFGGLCALDLARSGVDVKGVVSFHGLLHSPQIEKKAIQAKILALHGYDDPMVSKQEVLSFEKEMNEAKVDWQLHLYGKTMHAFTNPDANEPNMGTVYNPLSEKRAFWSMRSFFGEVFHEE